MAPARVTPLEVAVDNQEADGDGTDNDQKETYSPDRRKVARRVSRRISNSADVNEQSAEDAADTVREGTQASFFRDQFTPPGFISSNSAFQGVPVVASFPRMRLSSRSRVCVQSDGTWCSYSCCSS